MVVKTPKTGSEGSLLLFYQENKVLTVLSDEWKHFENREQGVLTTGLIRKNVNYGFSSIDIFSYKKKI